MRRARRPRMLARISHQISAAEADPGMSTALRSVGFLDVLSSTPAESSWRAPCSHARLRLLATKPGEKRGLMGDPTGKCITVFRESILGRKPIRFKNKAG